MMKRLVRALFVGVVAIVTSADDEARVQTKAAQNTAPTMEWPTYGHDPGGMRFSPLTQMTPANVSQLQVAWVYHMRPADTTAPAGAGAAAGGGAAPPGRGRGRGGSGFASSQTTPLVINGVMYISSPYGRVVALDPMSGKEVWVFQLPSGNASTRGVEYWPGDATLPPQIVFGSGDGKLYSLDAKTGRPNETFGDKGVVNLNTPEILQGSSGNNGLSSPPIVYRNLIIIGGRTQESPGQGTAGDVRAWDVHTGRLVWTFRSVPRAGEKYNDTWAGESWKNRSGVNVWGFMSVDVQRGIVYMPFGAPSVDQYGGDRVGDNLFGTSLVAADANTGAYLWHFQVVHHDVWDADLAGAPVLMDVRQGTRTIPAVAVINKPGLLFLLDRVNGKPIYGVLERPVPQSEVPLERTSKTQPFPLKPPPLSRMTMTAADIATVTPELEAACRKLMEGMQLGGPYLPQGYKRLRVQFPGNHGGVNWGGTSFNPQLGYLFVNTNDLGQVAGLTDRDPNTTGPARAAGQGNRVDPNGPYQGVPGGGRFKDSASNMMCQQPPWGQLTAVNVNTGEFAWRVPLGVTDSLPPDKQNTGRPGNGGSIATAGGLVFIGATDDSRFRAFDARTGKELWTIKLGAAAHATPSTYLGRDGRQYVVITSTGGGALDAPVTDDSITAFALRGPGTAQPPPYAAGETGGIVQLQDTKAQTTVSVKPSAGNVAFEMLVKGQNVLNFSGSSPEEFRGGLTGIPFVGPWANRLDEQAFYANGKRYAFDMQLGNVRGAIPIHGLGLASSNQWQVVEAKADNTAAWVTSKLEFYKNPLWMKQFPFAHTVEMTYRLQNGVLEVSTIITNLAIEPMPVAIGFHPYFQLTDTPRSDWTISVGAKTHWLLAETKVPTGETEPIEKMFPNPSAVPLGDYDLDDVFGDLVRDSSGRATMTVKGTKSQQVDVMVGPNYRAIVIWAPKNRNFICFEPMAGITNAMNLAHKGLYKEMQSLLPGGTWQGSFWIRPSGY